MTLHRPVLALVVVCHNGRRHLEACLGSILASDDLPVKKHVFVVDNASGDNSAEFVRERFPDVTVIRNDQNLGYAGGANTGWQAVRMRLPNTQYLGVLNQDIVVESGWLKPLIACLEANPAVGQVQPMIRLMSDPQRVNTAGNRSHFLGFGFVTECGNIDCGQYASIEPIDFASGAAFLIPTNLVGDNGPFFAPLFMYLEDQELSWRLRLQGHTICAVRQSIVYHDYGLDKSMNLYFFLERNRWILLLTHYRVLTLILLVPALIGMELGQWVFAARHRCFRLRLKVYGWFLMRVSWRILGQHRREVQRQRRIKDSQFLKRFSGRVEIATLDSRLSRWIGNPLFTLYWKLSRLLIRW